MKSRAHAGVLVCPQYTSAPESVVASQRVTRLTNGRTSLEPNGARYACINILWNETEREALVECTPEMAGRWTVLGYSEQLEPELRTGFGDGRERGKRPRIRIYQVHTVSTHPDKRAHAGQNSRKDRRCQHKTGETETRGPPTPHPGRKGGVEGIHWPRRLGNFLSTTLRSHSHTNRTLDSLNNVECQPPPSLLTHDPAIATTGIQDAGIQGYRMT